MPSSKKEACASQSKSAKAPSKCCKKCSTENSSNITTPNLLPHKSTKSPKTRILVHFDCGFGNELFIRGEGISTLSWNKGKVMQNCGPSEWIWESDRPFSVAQFKILLNDASYEQGDNHIIAYGNEINISPSF